MVVTNSSSSLMRIHLRSTVFRLNDLYHGAKLKSLLICYAVKYARRFPSLFVTLHCHLSRISEPTIREAEDPQLPTLLFEKQKTPTSYPTIRETEDSNILTYHSRNRRPQLPTLPFEKQKTPTS